MKFILAVVFTFLITGPIGIVVGFKMAEKQKYQLGEHHGRADALKQLHEDVRSHLGYRLSGTDGSNGRQGGNEPAVHAIELLYQVDGSYIHLVEVAGVRTLATGR